jgi:pyridoxamine 5'-phosphate oxidase
LVTGKLEWIKSGKMTTDPIRLFLKWYAEARTGRDGRLPQNRVIFRSTRVLRRFLEALFPWSNLFRPDIATLATVTPENRPAARSVLFKGLVQGGFSFYTDGKSNKAKEFCANPWAVLVFYWHFPPRQVRIDGRVVKLSRKAVEADWSIRKRENQAASAALPQSSIIEDRKALMEKVHQIKRRYKGKPIPCPDTWSGYCLMPDKMEFWEGRLDWIHLRERYVLDRGTWQKVVLAP